MPQARSTCPSPTASASSTSPSTSWKPTTPAARTLSKRNDEPEKASRPYDKDRDGSKALTPTKDTATGNTFITGVTVDNAGHIVDVKSREAVIDLVKDPTLKSSATTKDTDSDANSAANIDFSIRHGGTKPEAHLKVEGAGATTVASSNDGKTLKISSTD